MTNGDKVSADYLASLKQAEVENYKVLAALETIRVNQFVPFSLHVMKTSGSDTTSQVIETDPLESGYVYIVTTISAVDYTDAAHQIRLGVHQGDGYYVYESATVAAIGDSVEYVGQLMCKETDRIFANFLSIGENDEIHLFINGYKIKR